MSSHQDSRQLLVWVPRLRRYARALVGNRDDADDLVQDTLERAWTRAELWHGVGDMRAWLFGIMHNLHVDGVRRRRVQMVSLDDDPPPSEPSAAGAAASAGSRLAVLELQAALERLPIEQREILLLVALEDMAYADVAKLLGIPIGTVMSRLSRARERLRTLMDDRPGPTRLKVVK